MSIIDAILENPVIIFVIIGIISSIFSKKKQPKPVQRHERIPPTKTVIRRAAERGAQPPQNSVQPAHPPQVQQPVLAAQETNDLIERAERAMTRKNDSKMQNVIKNGSVENQDLTKSDKRLDLKSDHVLQGLIWAEVLSAPKAKRKRNI